MLSDPYTELRALKIDILVMKLTAMENESKRMILHILPYCLTSSHASLGSNPPPITTTATITNFHLESIQEKYDSLVGPDYPNYCHLSQRRNIKVETIL